MKKLILAIGMLCVCASANAAGQSASDANGDDADKVLDQFLQTSMDLDLPKVFSECAGTMAALSQFYALGGQENTAELLKGQSRGWRLQWPHHSFRRQRQLERSRYRDRPILA